MSPDPRIIIHPRFGNGGGACFQIKIVHHESITLVKINSAGMGFAKDSIIIDFADQLTGFCIYNLKSIAGTAQINRPMRRFAAGRTRRTVNSPRSRSLGRMIISMQLSAVKSVMGQFRIQKNNAATLAGTVGELKPAWLQVDARLFFEILTRNLLAQLSNPHKRDAGHYRYAGG